MRKLIMLFAMLVTLMASAQSTPLSFSDVIQVEGKTKDEIYGGLREWVATSYVNGKAVTQMEDQTTGTIILKAAFPFKKGGIYKAYDGTVRYMLKLQCKDGRFRAEMNSITHENKPGLASDCSLGLLTKAAKSGQGGLNKMAHDKVWNELKAKASEEFRGLTQSLRQITNFSSTTEEDW